MYLHFIIDSCIIKGMQFVNILKHNLFFFITLTFHHNADRVFVLVALETQFIVPKRMIAELPQKPLVCEKRIDEWYKLEAQ